MKVFSLSILLMFLGFLSGGVVLKSTAVSKYYERNSNDYREREEMKDMLDALVLSFNDLVILNDDYEKHPVLESLRSSYLQYALTIKDVSSGCNLNFLPDSKLSDSALAEFLFTTGSTESFLAFRKSNGFVTDVTKFTPFLKEEAFEAVVCNGWMAKIHQDSDTGNMLKAVFGKAGDDLYPIVNELPLINVNNVYLELLLPMLSDINWKIPNVTAKATALKSKLEQGHITEGELRSVLDLPENHEVYKYLGVKTAFWSLSYKKGYYRMDAIIAAVPERNSKNINRYVLIEGKLSREY